MVAEGTPENGQIPIYDETDMRLEWSFPFEFPRVRLARDIVADGQNAFVLAATIDRTSQGSINVLMSITMSRTSGSGTCSIAFYRSAAATAFGTTVIVTSGGGNPKEATNTSVTATITGALLGINSVIAQVQRVGATDCAVDAGNAMMTLSLP